MLNKFQTFILFLFGGTLFLSYCFYDNNLNVVESQYYGRWEKTYERVVIGRLAKSQQDGIFSNGGLLGLANTPDGWDFELDTQYLIYNTGENVEFFTPYKSHPGFQGIVYSVLDLITKFPPQQNIFLIRIITTILSAFTLSFFCAYLAVEFGWLSAVLVILFSAFSEWIILPASNSYWNLWAFYLPFVTSVFLVADASKNENFPDRKIYLTLFFATLIKVLFTGFEMITTTLIMISVPYVYYAIIDSWKWTLFINRLFKLGLVLFSATLLGLFTLTVQIAANDGNFANSIEYISNTLNRRAAVTTEKTQKGPYAESKNASVTEVVSMYLEINAFNSQTPPRFWQAQYLHLILVFTIFSIAYTTKHKFWKLMSIPKHGLGLIASTWYSIAAPLSWYIIFKPTSYIHTFLFPMAWQMPFTLLGFALCGYVISDLFKRKTD